MQHHHLLPIDLVGELDSSKEHIWRSRASLLHTGEVQNEKTVPVRKGLLSPYMLRDYGGMCRGSKGLLRDPTPQGYWLPETSTLEEQPWKQLMCPWILICLCCQLCDQKYPLEVQNKETVLCGSCHSLLFWK